MISLTAAAGQKKQCLVWISSALGTAGNKLQMFLVESTDKFRRRSQAVVKQINRWWKFVNNTTKYTEQIHYLKYSQVQRSSQITRRSVDFSKAVSATDMNSVVI